jgi:hypothetical protein
MMCKRPYLKNPNPHLAQLVTKEDRLAATPFPCGQCIPCKVNRSRVWVHRMLLEQLCHGDSCFVTLTYDDEHLPNPPQVDKKEHIKFVKRLRKYTGKNIRYFCVGEYGKEKYRPHYHYAIYGLSYMHRDKIDRCWPLGFTFTGDLNKDTARYMTKYIIKDFRKINDHSIEFEPELYGLNPEFMCSSRGTKKDQKGGLGKEAVVKIAKARKNNNYSCDLLVRSLNYGKRQYPLGRYLTQVLSREMGLSDVEVEKEFNRYQSDLFAKHACQELPYRESIRREKEERRKQQLAKMKIWHQRRKI